MDIVPVNVVPFSKVRLANRTGQISSSHCVGIVVDRSVDAAPCTRRITEQSTTLADRPVLTGDLPWASQLSEQIRDKTLVLKSVRFSQRVELTPRKSASRSEGMISLLALVPSAPQTP